MVRVSSRVLSMPSDGCFELRSPRHFLQLLAGFGIACGLAAELGDLLLTTTAVTSFRPPTGLLWAALICFPLRRWPELIATALIAILAVRSGLHGVPLGREAGLFVIDALGAAVGVNLLRLRSVQPFVFDSLKGVIQFAAVSLLVTFALTAPLAAGFLHMVQAAPFPETWLRLGLADWSGIWFTAPWALSLVSNWQAARSSRLLRQPVEAVCLLASLSLMTYGLYFGQFGWLSMNFVLMLWLLWAAVRFGTEGVTLAAMIMAAFAARSVALGVGPFVLPGSSLQEAELRVLLYPGIASLVFQSMAGILAERGRALAALREWNADLDRLASERGLQLESALAAMSDAVCIFDAEGRVAHCNEAFLRFHGFIHPSQAGTSLTDYTELLEARTAQETVLPPDDWPAARALRGESGFDEELQISRKGSGETWFASVNFAPIRGKDGKIAGAVLTGRDVSERWRREQALRKLSLAVEQSSNSVIITDLEGHIEFVNEAFVRNSGYTREDVLGKTPNLISSGQTLPETFAVMWQSLRKGRVWSGEFINRAKDGRIYTDAVSVWPLRQPDGRITHYVAEQIDITRQKLERAELDSYRRGLEKLVEERTAALQVALHDLEASQENARRVMEWVSAIILIADHAGRFVYANPAGLLALGYSLGELQGMQIADLVADGDHPELYAFLAALGRGESQIRAWTLMHKDGRAIPFQLNTQQLPDGRYIAIGYDRSRELAAELQLRLAASVFENSCEGILITDAEGTIIDVNQAFVSLTGYSRDEAIGQSARLLNSGLHDKAFFSAMRESYRERGYWVGELWNRRKDGRVVRHMMTISAVQEAGQISRLIGLFTDITEKAEAELRLQQSEERLRLTTESLGIGLWYWKPLDGVLEGNKRCWRLFGHDAGWRPRFKDILKTIHPKDRRQVGRELLQATRSARTFNQEFRVLRPNGTVVWLSAMGTTYCNSLGPEIQVMGICMDISGRKSAEILLKTQHESLEASDRQKDAFIAMLSHEIRNPLAAINNAMAVLRRSAKQDPTVQWTEHTVAGQLQQLNRLVGDLLDVSRIAQGKLEFKRSRFVASELMQQAVAISQPVIDRLGQRLHIHADIEGLYLEGDMARLVQVFDNLLQNAAKYTPAHGEIWVRAEAVAGEFVLSVRDSGIGIEAELLPRIFEPFVQGKHLPDHADSGMGIGLALAKRLVQLHGGSIHAESPGPGQGSTVTVHLPLAGQRTTPRRQPRLVTPATPQESRPLQVLVVDDIPSVADSFGMLLELIGHQVRIANSGGEAVQRVRECRPDVVFLDIGLPDMTGFDAFSRIRELPGGADLPVVALTGFGQSQDLKRTAEAGFYGHLVKPADPDEVEALLRGLGGKPLEGFEKK